MATIQEDKERASELLRWMKSALEMARYALQHGEVPVGCVVVYQGKIIARGCNEVNISLNATRHAEMVAFDQLVEYCSKQNLPLQDVCSSSAIYVTVEPCIMCSYALRLTGLCKIIFGCRNDRFGGCGSVLDIHDKELQCISDSAGASSLKPLEITAGVMSEEAIALLQQFYEGDNPKTCSS